mgnify:CR=1 FL=1
MRIMAGVMNMEKLAIGIMSGTSLDGIDLAQIIFNFSENGTIN